ncbi:hypothetical protein ACFE04_008690 [Oxalis oulophora]
MSLHEEPYLRAREDPFFKGLLKRNDHPMPDAGLQSSSQFKSDNISGDTNTDTSYKEIPSDVTENFLDDSVSESFTQSVSAKLAQMDRKTTSLTFKHLIFDLGDTVDSSVNESEEYSVTLQERPPMKRSYTVNKRKSTNLSNVPLPQSAASFYNGSSPTIDIVESSESIEKLNSYLKSAKDEINAGVPGRFLHAVIGQDVSDLSSIVSTILYAFNLNEKLVDKQYFIIVPVLNMKRSDLNAHSDIKWLLDSCQIDQTSLIFVDEIDLSYYDLFGSLKLILLNGAKLPTKQEALKEAVVEVFNCGKGEIVYPRVQTVTFGEGSSCCTLIAEIFLKTSPEILAGQAFSRLLLAGILLDTENISNPDCSIKDKYMATLLINGAGRFGCNVKYKMHDVSELKVVDILRKDFKSWTRVIGKVSSISSRVMVSQIGMSSIGISMEQLLSHEEKSTSAIKHFNKSEKLQLLVIVSGYYDTHRTFMREILIAAESMELLKNLLSFLNANASRLPLEVLHHPGLRENMAAFKINKVTSRRIIEGLLEEFCGISKH